MKITYEGFYGFKNAGDDAFVEVCAWGARKYWNCEDNNFIGEFLPKTLNPINTHSPFKIIKGLDRLSVLANLIRSDYFISAGGSTFSEAPWHVNKMAAYHYKKIHKNLKLGAIGVSLGPFKNIKDERAVIKYLKALDFLALRDKRSFDYVNTLNLPYDPVCAFDLAALLPLIYDDDSPTLSGENESGKENIKIVGISVCLHETFVNGDKKKERERISFFKELVELINHQAKVHFKVFIINGAEKRKELEVSLEVMHNIGKDRVTFIPYSPDVHKTWNKIASCDLMISTRLHASIFACYAGTPFILIEYHQKCTDFLNDIGQNDAYRVYDAQVSPTEILPTVLEVLGGVHNPPENIANTMELALLNFTQTIKG